LWITILIGPESTMWRNPIRVAPADRSAEAIQTGTAGSEQLHPERRASRQLAPGRAGRRVGRPDLGLSDQHDRANLLALNATIDARGAAAGAVVPPTSRYRLPGMWAAFS
jgi:hypothetical protein